MDYIKDWTGMDDQEAAETQKQFFTWFSGNWYSADTNTIDNYIDKDGAFDGEIYRGMHFTEDEYANFMKDVAVGSKIGMRGHNSSWAADQETAWGFSINGDRHVIIRCAKNKTSAPVSHLSTHGENEVIAHSKAQWTVIGVVEGNHRTEITVIEAEDRMSDEEWERRRSEKDAAPVQSDSGSFEKRMNEQNQYFVVIPANNSAQDGGPGSGNFGHAGRPGQIGGSSSEEGGSSSPKMKEEPEDKLDWLFADLWDDNEEEEPEDPEAKARAEQEEKDQREREAYGQNGLSESEYPEELRLTPKERDAIIDVFRGYKDDGYRQKSGADIMNALNGFPVSSLEQREQYYTGQVEEANEMIAKRKEEGYSFKDYSKGVSSYERKKAWWDFYNEHGYPPDAMVGEAGIKHWQSQRKKALKSLSEIEIAKKIAKRYEFAEKSDKFMPWRKNPKADDPRYRPWESEDAWNKI